MILVARGRARQELKRQNIAARRMRTAFTAAHVCRFCNLVLCVTIL